MRRLVFALSLLLAAVAGPNAFADTARIPQDGSPALQLDLPPGWVSQKVEAAEGVTYSIVDPGHTHILVVDLQSNPNFANLQERHFDILANGAFKAADAVRTGDSYTTLIDGREAITYNARKAIPGGSVAIYFSILKLDSSHILMAQVICPLVDTPAQVAAAKAILANAKIIP